MADALSREYMPDMHAVQDDAPSVFENLPATQSVQYMLIDVDCKLLALPLAQGVPVHVDCPSSLVYVPETHGVHVSGDDTANTNFPTPHLSLRVHSVTPMSVE